MLRDLKLFSSLCIAQFIVWRTLRRHRKERELRLKRLSLVRSTSPDVRKFQAENPGWLIPVDLITSSGSGLDPHISPAAAEFQVPRVARERRMTEAEVHNIVGGQ